MIIDAKSPILNAILMEDSLTFLYGENLGELNVHAKYIVMREGKFWNGITSRLSISPAAFWANGDKNVGDWLTLTATLMNLDPSTIKVVGRKSRRLL